MAVGDSTELEIIFSTGKRAGPSSKRPTITTNEGPPDKRVSIKAHVIRQPDSTFPAVMNPYRLFVSKAGEVEVSEAKFTVTNVSDEDFTLTLVSTPPGYFKIDLPAKVKAGKAVECKLTVFPEYLAGAFEKSITIECGDATKTRFTIPVLRRIIGASKTTTGQTKAGGH